MKKSELLFVVILSFCLAACGNEYHVSQTGNDSNSGTKKMPFRTISKAAEIARPGDVITVHEGVYREWVNPPHGGENKAKMIVYRAASGKNVEIKGSEIIKGWCKSDGNTWKVDIPNTFFGDFNPYSDTIYGDWLEKGQWCHTGEVYLNNKALSETPELEKVFSNYGDKALWYCQVSDTVTTIWANFDCDPNKETVEINVRKAVFYPENPYINYICVRGFQMSHAATPWAPPTAEQVGLIGTHWSKGWVIEDNTITHSKCVGITLGKYGDEWDNRSESAEAFVRTTERALENYWNREHIGSHTVRNNTVSHCGQAGIAGSLGAIFSEISDNTIYDIGMHQSFWGYELAGIKFHAPVDVVISNNHIYRTEGGIWLDWMSQGTRVTGNLLHDNKVQDLSLEVNHGPVLVDNNIFLSEELAQVKLSQGVVFLNNLIAWKIWPTGIVDSRETPYLEPHDTRIAGLHDCPCGDAAYYNNIFTRIYLTPYDECKLPVKMSGNVYLSGAAPAKIESHPYVDPEYVNHIKIIEKADGWYLQINVMDEWLTGRERRILNTDDFGNAVIPDQSYGNADGGPIVFDRDYLGNIRNDDYSYPGPLEFGNSGEQLVKVYPCR